MAAATPQRPDPPHNNGITDTVASSATTMVASAERTFANTSPASTYGETAVGEESSPSTPRDRESKSKSYCFSAPDTRSSLRLRNNATLQVA